MLDIQLPSAEQPLNITCKNDHNVSVWVKRDDLIHPIMSGNKWRKLSYTLQNILDKRVNRVISFGGGYSNHLHALSYACHTLQLPFTAIVRGNYHDHMTPTLLDMQKWGTDIEFVNKITYQQKDQTAFRDALAMRHPNSVVIPEGGSQQDALAGMADLISELGNHYDVILAPVASGATLAGLIQEQSKHQSEVIGIAVLKGQDYLQQLVERFLPSTCAAQAHTPNWHIEHGYHHGGYAKHTPELLDFCSQFNQTSQISIEPVYSGKLFFALNQMIENNLFQANQRILAIHTGGLQGARTTLDKIPK
jgi:1-aminocyclopropane-1-carboxylate deaminase